MKVLAIVVTRGLDFCEVTVNSLSNQTVKPDIHVEIGYPIAAFKDQVGKLVCYYFNKAITEHNLNDYDYVLKIDEDVKLPLRFLEVNCTSDLDLMGYGRALLIKAHPFLEVMNGKLTPNNIHAGLIHRIYQQKGLPASWHYLLSPLLLRNESRNLRKFFFSGFDQYVFGDSCTRFFFRVAYGLLKQPFLLGSFFGYLYAGLTKQQRYTL